MEMFGAVSFSGETRAGPFYKQIHSGRKTRTLRERRKDGRPHVKPGYSFVMYWKMRTRLSKQNDLPIYYIGIAECVAYEPVKIVDHWNDEEFAKSDGFQDIDEFRDWWFPEWRETLWLNDVIEAYKQLEDNEVVIELMASKFGRTAMMEFLELEYMMIQWKYPLIEKGNLHT